MTVRQQNEQANFNARNSDWKERTLEDEHEIVKYQNDSTVRIWYNVQNAPFNSHWHTALEVIIPVENFYDVATTSGNYHVLPGEILVIAPGEPHKLTAPPTGSRFIYLFDISHISSIKGFSAIQAILNGCIHITSATFPQSYDEIYGMFMDMKEDYFNCADFYELAIYSRLTSFFVILGENHYSNTELATGAKVYKQKEYLNKFNTVMEYIDTHYMEELSLDDMANFSGFSKYYFTRLFKRYTDSTFYEYLCLKRIKVVEQLLEESDLSITEIALQAGFSSISTFNRTFKQQKQCTPTEFRLLCRKVHFTA